jgi:4-alpha-glucanotransferase
MGDFSGAARLVPFLAGANLAAWQVLPLGPLTGAASHSPYRGPSAFALEPAFASAPALVAEGWLDPADLPRGRGAARADPGRAQAEKERLLREAHARFLAGGRTEGLDRFRAEQRAWLEDFALFRVLERRAGHASWTTWTPALRDRDPAALRRAGERFRAEVSGEAFAQWVLDRQWREVRGRLRAAGIRVVGDLPMYVDGDGADVWANRRLFDLAEDGRPRHVAGVPPDAFSETGQRWGNPVYDWDALAAEGYAWWVRRLERNLAWFDVVRLDHFRGFAAGWRVPAGEEDARKGAWVPGPGEALFRALAPVAGPDELLAEDLGVIDAPVKDLLRRLGLPGLKVLQFAFGADGEDHLPRRHVPRSVVYTGTHDNDTARGWWRTAPEAARAGLARLLGRRPTPQSVADDLVWLAYDSVARLAVVPLQDHLGLGSAARVNVPGTPTGNWTWRAPARALTPALARRLSSLAEASGRGAPGA